MKQLLSILTGAVIVTAVALLGFRVFHKSVPVPVQEANAATMPVLQPSQAIPARPTAIKEVFQDAPEVAEMLRAIPESSSGSVAVAKIGDRLKKLSPDDNGHYERVYLQPRQKIALAVAFPRGEPGQKIAVESQDGGVIGEGGPVQVLVLDEGRRIGFSFQPTENTGINRVTMRLGAQVQELNFWVGPELIYDESRVIADKR